MSQPAMVMGIETEYSLVFPEDALDEPEQYIGSVRHGDACSRFKAMSNAARSSALLMGPLLQAVIKEQHPEIQFLGNGSRFYLDGDHPEMSVAECSDPRDAVLYDEAGVHIMRTLSKAARTEGAPFRVYKRSADGWGHTWGCHENYSVSPRLFTKLTDGTRGTGCPYVLGTFLAVRQLLTGAGKVGPDSNSPRYPFQLSQRADFITAFQSGSTLCDRAIINMRDEPLADAKEYSRLHLICGEANRLQWATYLKLALTAGLLMMLEAVLERDSVFVSGLPIFDANYPEVFRHISCDVTLESRYPVRVYNPDNSLGGKRDMSGVEILGLYVEAIGKNIENAVFAREEHRVSYRTAVSKAAWAVKLLTEGKWRSLYGILEWPTKRVLIDEYLNRKGRTWESAIADPLFWARVRTLGMLNFTIVDDDTSVYDRLVSAGRIQEVVRPGEVIRAISRPPSGRAQQRVALASRYARFLHGIDWNTVIFKQPEGLVIFKLNRPDGAVPTLDHALSVCKTPLALFLHLEREPIAGITSVMKVV